ncbi:hypothetical protein HCB69_00590 [Listeria booriae]|uniref:Uncharacterized protein n=1 Tax=Listeria booriae TaxID=1552123 RepID=A0A842FIT6_9LIST|nr:hypothetical protein [Listeria booriae]MBC2282869.1 hypothetical protein [Listeria booriae]MBC2291945.1 hypothetical protein [Listeria booriae]
MSTDKYYFTKQFSFKNIETIRDEGVALLDIFEENEDKVYGIDFLPKAMMNAYIYDSYFNVYYRSKQKEDIAAHKVYEERFLKVILTIMGYSHDTYVESDALLKKHGTDIMAIPADAMGNVHLSKPRKSWRYFYQRFRNEKREKQIDLLSLFQQAFRDYTDVAIYLCDLQIILFFSDLYVVCLIENEESREFLEHICTTEGLYLRS